MKSIFFKEISIQNFLSIGNEPVAVNFRPGLHIITGENKDKAERRNGVGKTTILDALCFAIYGEPIREIPNDKIYNNVTKKGSLVELTFDVIENGTTKSYKVIRSLAPSKCFVYENDVDVTQSAIAKTNDKIRECVGTGLEVFKNAVIMTVNETTPFMAQKGSLKRKFIEGIMNVGIFGEMLLSARASYNDTKREYDLEAVKIPTIRASLATLEQQICKFDAARKEKIEELEKERNRQQAILDQHSKEITLPDEEEYKKSAEEIKNIEQKIEDIDKQIEEITLNATELSATYKQNKKNLEELEDSLGKIHGGSTAGCACPLCRSTLDGAALDRIRQSRDVLSKLQPALYESISKCKLQVDGFKAQRQECLQRKRTCTDIREKYIKCVSECSSKTSKSASLSMSISKMETDIKRLQSDTDRNKEIEPLLSAQKELLQQQHELNATLDGIRTKLNIWESVKFVVSEEGVKSQITKKILQLLNSKINYYLQKMDANCTVTFNEFFEEKIVNDIGDECCYFNFSGAERKSIDLACLFTFMDIRRLQGDVYINISAYDELLDSSLDAKGIELVLDILKERVEKNKEGCYIVSHRKEASKQATGEVIYLEKHNRITRRVKTHA